MTKKTTKRAQCLSELLEESIKEEKILRDNELQHTGAVSGCSIVADNLQGLTQQLEEQAKKENWSEERINVVKAYVNQAQLITRAVKEAFLAKKFQAEGSAKTVRALQTKFTQKLEADSAE